MKKNIRVIVAFILGIVVTGTIVYAESIISANLVGYDHTNSSLSANNVQQAIDEVYDQSFHRKRITAYTYNEDSNASNYCVKGKETTCEESTCYETTSVGSCEMGTIIKYWVNSGEYHYFHVLHDDGNTITMIQSGKTVQSVWYDGGTGVSDTTKGPLTALTALESATKKWTNVNLQTYTMGETVLYETAHTSCVLPGGCNRTGYTMDERSGRARMITGQEMLAAGCLLFQAGGVNSGSCASWLPGTHSMSVYAYGSDHRNLIVQVGNASFYPWNNSLSSFPISAVVVISK